MSILTSSPMSARFSPGGQTAPAAMDQALSEWRGVLGDQHVKSDPATLARYARTTSVKPRPPAAVLYPDSTQQVREILGIASKHKIGVHPISRGKNWGYGDASGMRSGQVVLDLARMNRIIEVNEKLCYAVIEPGVTQGQLYNYIREKKLKVWVDVSAAGLEASIVGNALDRGFGHTRYGDHCLTTCGMQVVLGDGRVLNTGLGHFANAQAGRTYRYGIGPFLDGMFTQSNFGVVTQMGVWLMPEPEDFAAFFVFTPDDEALPELVDRLAALRMQGLLQSAVHIGNDLRLFSSRTRYPWKRAGGKTPLPKELRAQLRKEHSAGAWNVGGAIYGSRETVAAMRKVIKRALAGFKVTFINDRKLAMAGKVQRLLSRVGLGRRLGELLASVAPVYGLMKGIPTDDPQRGVGWRVRDELPPRPVDPLDCHVGLMWVAPLLPATGTAAQAVMRLIEPIYEKHGFEAAVTFTLITERTLVCVTNLSFDQRYPEEAAKAKACYDELNERLIGEGYIPYRTGPDGMAKLRRNSTVFWDVAEEIKRALDPAGIISPGRYEPSAA
jgi:4-cresol dehydrogenase (hydroxylating)